MKPQIRDRLYINNYRPQKKCPNQKCSPLETCINAVRIVIR